MKQYRPLTPEEEFLFATHMSGAISSNGLLGFGAFRGAALIQSVIGRVKIKQESGQILPARFVTDMTNRELDNSAAKMVPGYEESRSTEDISWCQYVASQSMLGFIMDLCIRLSQEAECEHAVRFILTPFHASMTVFGDKRFRAAGIWTRVAPGASYTFEAALSEDDPREKMLLKLLGSATMGFTTACRTLMLGGAVYMLPDNEQDQLGLGSLQAFQGQN